MRTKPTAGVPGLSGVLLAAMLWLPCSAGAQGVADVRIAEETAPAGGIAVIQIELTEPQPILSGRFSFTTPSGPLRQVRGVGLFSDRFDVVGVARLALDKLTVFFASFSASAGLSEELPVAVIAFDVAPNAQAGQQTQLAFGPGQIQLLGPGGQTYTNDLQPGVFEVGGLSITSVSPDRGEVPAGQTIVIRGVGFDPDADVDFDGVVLASTEVVSAAEIRVVASQAFRIDSRRIRIRNKNAEEEEFFFVFTPATRVPTTQHPFLRDLIPIFDDTLLSRGVLRSINSGGGAVSAVALENRGTAAAQVTVEVLDAMRLSLGLKQFALGPGERSLLEASEITPLAAGVENGFIVAQATTPIGMLGMRGLTTEDSLTPVILEDEQLAPPTTPPPANPTLTQGGAVLATLVPRLPMAAPRSLVSVFGENLTGDGAATSAVSGDLAAGRLPEVLGGVCLEVGGERASMLFVSDSQINAQIRQTGIRGPTSIVAVRDCGTPGEQRSQPGQINIADSAPGLFVMALDGPGGRNPIAALHGGGPRLVGDPGEIPSATAASPGEWISLFGTGFGATANGLAGGVIPQQQPTLDLEGLRVAGAVSVSIGGVTLSPADIQYVGAAPCCAGLDQIVARTPTSLGAGIHAVTVTVDGASSLPGPYIFVTAP